MAPKQIDAWEVVEKLRSQTAPTYATRFSETTMEKELLFLKAKIAKLEHQLKLYKTFKALIKESISPSLYRRLIELTKLRVAAPQNPNPIPKLRLIKKD